MYQYVATEWIKDVDLDPTHADFQKRSFQVMKDHLLLIKHDDNCCEDFWNPNS